MRRKILHKFLFFAIATLPLAKVHAQFTADLLRNDSYWGDGKAEFDIYDAQLLRGGQPRHCEVLHIFVRERIDPKTLVRMEDAKRSDAIYAIRMQQIWSAPIGMFFEQGSLTAFWRSGSGTLAQLNFIGSDSFGNVAKRLQAKPDENIWAVTCDSYREPTSTSSPSYSANVIFYDELPLRVRTTDFRKSPGEFEIQLAPSIANFGKTDNVQSAPAKISWKLVSKSIEVVAQHANG